MNKNGPVRWLQFTLTFGLSLLFFSGCSKKEIKIYHPIEIRHTRFNSVRFDPSYYYDLDVTVDELSEQLSSMWSESGITHVYMKVYDPIHGAVYKTEYPMNTETDYGRLDLLKAMLTACHEREIKVYAWIPAFQHKEVWLKHPEWRVKGRTGEDYQPSAESFFLCVRNESFREWWLGFIRELLQEYPSIDGVDIGEPVVTWKEGEGCYCEECMTSFGSLNTRSNDDSFDLHRSEPMTELLARTSETVHAFGKMVSITIVESAEEEGDVFSCEQLRAVTGIDLNAILSSNEKPDILNVELIWQQMASVFKDTVLFTPEWTYRATRQILHQIRDRANLVVHVEITPFDSIGVSDQQFVRSILSALQAGAWGIDFYDSYQLDQRQLWSRMYETFEYVPEKKVLVFYDPEGENDARQLGVLLRHFKAETQLVALDGSLNFSTFPEADVIFYMGVAFRPDIPRNFIRYILNQDATVCWINHNLLELGDDFLQEKGFTIERIDESSQYDIIYRDKNFTKLDSLLHIVTVLNPNRCTIRATARSNEIVVPYAINSGDFWYFADVPTSYVTEGGRHIVFSDLLHNVLREDHQENHTALVRIEDINPESDPESLISIARYLHSNNVPFAVGVTPLYLDPSTNTAVSLSEQPELVKALRYCIANGGSLVLHGCTHQYRGQTTIDYEFWDGLSEQPLFEDSEEYIKERIFKGLEECRNNGLFPLAWETPHYAASLLDYRTVDQYFTTVYERRQTMNILGTDQLLPFYIPSDGGHAQMIPENLGYIPYDDPSAERIIEFAEKNMAIRDGFASFFFHPFVPIDVLKDIVNGIQALGYQFSDLRSVTNRVAVPGFITATRPQEITVDLHDQYHEEFYITHKGKRTRRNVTDEKLDESITRTVGAETGWIYISLCHDQKRPDIFRNIWSFASKLPVRIDHLWAEKPIQSTNTPVSPLILLDSDAEGNQKINQESYISVFDVLGVDYLTIPVEAFFEIPENTNLIIVPHSAAVKLNEQQMLFLIGALSRGMNLILEKDSELSRRIGLIPQGDKKAVNSVRDMYYPQVEIHWKQEDEYQIVDAPIEYVPYYYETVSEDPIVVGGEYGDGKYLYFACMFDPITSLGYGRFPYFGDLIQRQFELWPLIKKENLEVYFEPGDREDVSIEDLVKMWKNSGFRKIYVAGWHMYSEWTYDYERLIRLAHQNAMLVYLWLELPHVNQKFWDDHPDWRERTALDEDAFLVWRRLMALTDPECRGAVFRELSQHILKYDWDGVNLAELYYESDLGPEYPEFFTPMHRSVREPFKEQYGFDPILLFDEESSYFWKRNSSAWNYYLNYRKDLLVQLHAEFLQFLYLQKRQKRNNMEIVVTVIDDILSEKGKWTGTDTKGIIALQERWPFTFQIEDPGELWHMSPKRYQFLSDTYSPQIITGGLIVDVNIVPYRDFNKSSAPTIQQTGMELSQLISNALQKHNRVALYSESTLYMVDLPWMAYTMGRHAQEKTTAYEWDIDTPSTVTMQLDPDIHQDILLDDRVWAAYHQGKAIIPPGHHEIRSIKRIREIMNDLKSTTRLVDISGELLGCESIPQGITMSVESDIPNYITVNEKPRRILLDGNEYKVEVYQGIPGYSFRLPTGRHEVEIHTRSRGAFSLKNISLVTSVLIVFISLIAATILIFLYTRRFRAKNR